MTGLMAVSYDIGFVLISFYVTHVLVKGHIPRIITIGFFTLGCGSVLFALPHFLTGDYEYSSGDIKDLCEDPEACVESDSKEKGEKKMSEAGIELARVRFAKKNS